MLFTDIIHSILSLISVMAIGYWLTKKNVFNEDSSTLFAHLAINITIPFLVFYNFISTFNPTEFEDLGMGLLLLFLTFLINYSLSIVIARIFNLPKNQHGIFANMFTLSNSTFIGLPVNIALFGEKSIPYALSYSVVNTIIFWTIGVYQIKKASLKNEVSGREFFKKLLTPPLISLLLSSALIVLKINIPRFILDTAEMVGGMTTPISLLYIGTVFFYLLQSRLRINKQILLVLIGRFIISPLIVFLVFHYTKLPVLMVKVFIIQAAMPVMTQLVIIAKVYNTDVDLAALAIFISTIIGLILIPVYMIIFNI